MHRCIGIVDDSLRKNGNLNASQHRQGHWTQQFPWYNVKQFDSEVEPTQVEFLIQFHLLSSYMEWFFKSLLIFLPFHFLVSKTILSSLHNNNCSPFCFAFKHLQLFPASFIRLDPFFTIRSPIFRDKWHCKSRFLCFPYMEKRVNWKIYVFDLSWFRAKNEKIASKLRLKWTVLHFKNVCWFCFWIFSAIFSYFSLSCFFPCCLFKTLSLCWFWLFAYCANFMFLLFPPNFHLFQTNFKTFSFDFDSQKMLNVLNDEFFDFLGWIALIMEWISIKQIFSGR